MFNKLVSFFFLMSSVFCMDLTFNLEKVLMDGEVESLQKLDLGEISSQKVEWALNRAIAHEKEKNFEMRDRFVSMALGWMEKEEIDRWYANSASSAPASAKSSKKLKFEKVYEEENASSDDVMSAVSEDVESTVAFESWFVSLLDQLGVLKGNYKELNDKLKEQYPHLSKEQLADHLIGESAKLTAGVGFVMALPGVIPGVGTAAQVALNVGSMVPDMIYMFKKQANLIFRIAELYGKDLQEEQRVTEALILFGVASGTSAAVKALSEYLERGITIYIQEKVTTELVTKGVTRAGTLNPILGDILQTWIEKGFLSETAVENSVVSLIPLVGAGVSGTMNYIFTKKVGQVAKVFYGDESTNKLQTIHNLQLPKVELAMFRALVKVMNADGVQDPSEVISIRKMAAKFPHNLKLVERMIKGDQALIEKLDYDLSSESQPVKEQILYAVTVLEYVDAQKGPEEIELHDKIVEKFGIDTKIAEQIEIRVKQEKDVSQNVIKETISGVYRSYQKLVGSREELEF